MHRASIRRALLGLVLAAAALGGCYTPDAKVTADEMGQDDTATYLILTDQLQRVRNVLKKPAKVCLGRLPAGPSGGLALVPGDVLERLRREQAVIEPQLELVASIECLAYFVRDKGPFTPEESDILVYSGELEPRWLKRRCGDLLGGFYDRANFDRAAEYDVEIENGVARLTGGHCPALRMVRIG